MKSMEVVFNKIPTNLQELKASEYASLSKPEYAAALFLAAMKVYPTNVNEALEMVQFLQGPKELTPYDKQFIRDRMMDKGGYIANSYFRGATVENDYTPTEPFSVTFTDNPYSYANEGYVKLFVKSAGGDNPRPVVMRHKPSTNQWFLWEQFLLVGIRQPASQDAWR